MEETDKLQDNPAVEVGQDVKEDVKVTSLDPHEATTTPTNDGGIQLPATADAQPNENVSKDKTESSQDAAAKGSTENGPSAPVSSSSSASPPGEPQTTTASTEPTTTAKAETAAAADAEDAKGDGTESAQQTGKNSKEGLTKKLTLGKYSVTCCLVQ